MCFDIFQIRSLTETWFHYFCFDFFHSRSEGFLSTAVCHGVVWRSMYHTIQSIQWLSNRLKCSRRSGGSAARQKKLKLRPADWATQPHTRFVLTKFDMTTWYSMKGHKMVTKCLVIMPGQSWNSQEACQRRIRRRWWRLDGQWSRQAWNPRFSQLWRDMKAYDW